MVIRRSTPRVERMRRALVEEQGGADVSLHDPDGGNQSESRPSRRYPQTIRQQLPHLCDLIPHRAWSLTVWILICITLLVALVAADASYRAFYQPLQIDLSPMSLQSDFGFASSVSTLVFLVGAGYAALVLMIRRHRIDDYRARYRVWYPVTATLMACAVLRTSGIPAMARSAFEFRSPAALQSDITSWLPIAVCVLAALAAMRVAFECRASRGAFVCFLLAVIAVSSASLMDTPWVPTIDSEVRQLATGSLYMAAQLSGLMLLVFYARYVDRDAMGLIEHDLPEVAETQTAKSASRRFGFRWRRKSSTEDEPSTRSKKPATGSNKATKTSGRADSKKTTRKANTAAPRKTSKQAPATTADEPTQSSPKSSETSRTVESETESRDEATMSRAERKRLRKEKRKQRKAA